MVDRSQLEIAGVLAELLLADYRQSCEGPTQLDWISVAHFNSTQLPLLKFPPNEIHQVSALTLSSRVDQESVEGWSKY